MGAEQQDVNLVNLDKFFWLPPPLQVRFHHRRTQSYGQFLISRFDENACPPSFPSLQRPVVGCLFPVRPAPEDPSYVGAPIISFPAAIVKFENIKQKMKLRQNSPATTVFSCSSFHTPRFLFKSYSSHAPPKEISGEKTIPPSPSGTSI